MRSFLVLALLLTSCATMPKAEVVPTFQDLRAVDQSTAKNCTLLGEVKGDSGHGFMKSNDSVRLNAANDLRENALKLGANAIQMTNTHVQRSTGGGMLIFDDPITYLSYKANAYKCTL